MTIQGIIMTQAKLKELFTYRDGQLIRRIQAGSRGKVGDIAGSLHPSGYILVRIKGKHYRLHRLVWLYCYGSFPSSDLDHIDHDKANNLITNLRLVTKQENQRNLSIAKNNKTGTTGVHWCKTRKRYIAEIRIDNKTKHLGCFLTLTEAVKCREDNNKRYGFHKNHGT